MLYLASFAASRWIVQNPDGLVDSICKLLKFPFPQAVTIAIRTSAVGGYDYFDRPCILGHLRMDSTASTAVSLLIPTFTNPRLANTL